MNGLTHMISGSLLAAIRPFLAQLPDSFWMPSQASTTAGEVDRVFFVIYWISVFFFAIIVGLMALFVVRYRRRHPGDEAVHGTQHHSVPLEITWTVIPIAVSVVIFVLGFRGYMDMATPPRNAYEIQVTGQKWQWFFTYPNGFVTSELHVPEDRPVKLTMTSEDVIHSLWIPAFRVKKDVVPGRYNHTWFEATEPGTYPLLCTEYCGSGHSDMLTVVTVHPSGTFDQWLQEASNVYDTMPPADAGKLLVQRSGCIQCHNLEGNAGIGPTFKNLYGYTQKLRGGGEVTAEDNYIRRSILEPLADVVLGYEPVMPTYAGKLKDKEITYIITYMKSISDRGGSTEEAAADAPAGDAANANPDAATGTEGH
ncbi:MAG: cytochrome c oxidase subunit II [Candidatus Krumholzibacteriia bacterium]